MSINTKNNFDLIRLFAATQVAIVHISDHLQYKNYFIDALAIFPGVPIFFFVSGFLIYGSYEKSIDNVNTNYNFFIKRFLRLYPALWMCLILSILSIWYSGYFDRIDLSWKEFIPWFLAQASFFQFFNPEFLRDYGVGVINGSLWTISVELQFYILTPLLFLILKRVSNTKAIIFVIFFVIINVLNSRLNDESSIILKLFGISFLPWIYMFIMGALLYKNQNLLAYIKRVPLFLLIIFFIAAYFLTKDFGWGNSINPLGYFLLLAIIIRLAFSLPGLSDSILRRNDFSYGIYIFHMPIVSYLLNFGITGIEGFLIALASTAIIAVASWFFLEKQCLRLKSNALRKL